MASSAKIQAIDKHTVHKICSGQVILDLATAVKELVENALDAGASNIEVKLKEHGADSIEVADNGTGISPNDYHALTLKYHTSKLQAFADLQELNSFGFRGEALSSLCALADVHVVTRQADQSAGVKLEFDHAGNLTGTGAAARSIGTTICVKNIFKPLPVRFKEFRRNVKKEYSRMIVLLQAYALISTGVRIICTSQTGNGARSTVVSTQAAQSVRDNIVTVFGPRTADGLEALEASASNGLKLTGYVSKGTAGMSRATGDRQFLFLNGRPIDLPKATKVVNDTFRSLASPALAHHKPMFVINIVAPPHSYDVNVTPDKRKVFMQDEAHLLTLLQEALNEVWEPTRSRYEVNGTQQAPKRSSKRPRRATEAESSEEDEEEADGLEGSIDIQAPPSSSPAVTPAYQRRIAKSSILSTLQRSAGQAYRSSPLGDPSRSSAGTPIQRSSARDGSTPQRPLVSCFSTFGSGRDSASRHPASGSSLPASTPLGGPQECRPSAHESSPPRRRTSPEPESEDQEAEGLTGLDVGDLAGDFSLTARPEASADVQNPKENAEPRLSAGEEDDELMVDVPDATPSAESLSDGAVEPPTEENIRVSADQVLDNDGGGLAVMSDHLEEPDGGEGGVSRREREEGVNGSVEAAASPCQEDAAHHFQAHFDLQGLRQRWKARSKKSADRPKQPEHNLSFQAASLQSGSTTETQPADADQLSAAASELERVFEKSQFKELKVLGQFNLGFILARLGNDLFIIDQHASDEKYNFERLTKSTQLKRQPLLQALPLDLTPSEVVVIREHMDIFAQNGFDLEAKDDGLFLKGVPFSQNVNFGAADVQELAQLLHEAAPAADRGRQQQSQRAINVSDKIPRPSKVRSMLAMRACRSSIMIGKTLDSRTMRQILDHLSELDSPWNCPHGRPTMRHLAVLPSP